MNGEYVREYEAVADAGTVTIFSLKHGSRLDLKGGDVLHVTLDSYGNEYVIDDEGREFFVGGRVKELNL